MRAQAYGLNEIPPKPSKSMARLAYEACRDPTLVMLITCALVSIGLSFYHPSSSGQAEISSRSDCKASEYSEQNLEWIEGVAILFAVGIVVFVTAFNDWRKEKQFRGLQNRIESDNVCSVVRNSALIQIHVKVISILFRTIFAKIDCT